MTAQFDWFRYSFGENGNLSTIPDVIQGGGELSFEEGWSSDYELDPDTEVNAKFISRAQHNQLWKTTTGNIKFWQQHLYPLYTAAADNGGVAVAYSFGTRVRFNPGGGEIIYEVIEAAGTDELPTVISDWVVVPTAYPRSGTAAGEQRTNTQNDSRFLIAGTAGGQIRTNDELDARYDDRYKAFASTGDIVPSVDTGMIARGFLRANGGEANRTTEAALYAIIGTTFGVGDGVDTFNLPFVPGIPVAQSLQYSAVGTYPGVSPTDVAVDASTGDVWICDDDSGDVYKLTGGAGSYNIVGAYPGTEPTGIAVNSSTGDVWVCDKATDDIYKLTGGAGTYDIVGVYPDETASCIAVNSSTGDVWVCDDGATEHNVYKLTGGSGTYNLIGDYPGTAPSSISVNKSTGDVWICDKTTDDVYKLTGGTGTYNIIGSIGKPVTFSTISVDDSNGDVWVCDSGASTDDVYMMRGGAGLYENIGEYPGGNPTGIAIDSGTKDLWICDDNTAAVYRKTSTPDINYYIKT